MVFFTRCIRGLGIGNLCLFPVSKETVVLRRWESDTCKFGVNKRVDESRITTVKKIGKADVSSVSPSLFALTRG